MTARLFRAGIPLLAVALVALPACKKKDEGPPGPGLDLPTNKELIRQSTSNLKQIGRAMYAYHDSMECLPRGFYGPDGKMVGLSWRVAILPHLGEGELYKQFRLNEPWDSEHNKKLIAKMPKVYAPPGVEDTNGHTYYCAFEGTDALMQPLPQPGPAFVDKKGFLQPERRLRTPGDPARHPRITSVLDGTSNTLMVVEAGEAVIWTKPQDIPFDKDKPLPPLGGLFRKVANVVMCDGSINYITRDTPEAVIKALITPAGGEAEAVEFFKDQETPDRGPRPDRKAP